LGVSDRTVADLERLPYTDSVVKETALVSEIGEHFATMVLTLKPRGAVRMIVEAA
jgi:hypothetical protein